MWEKLDDLSFKRSKKQAFGFFIVYLIFALILGGLFSGLAAAILKTQGTAEGIKLGIKIGPIIAGIYVTIISTIMLITKKLYKNIIAISFVLVAIPLTFLFGAFLGLIPLTILSTFKKSS